MLEIQHYEFLSSVYRTQLARCPLARSSELKGKQQIHFWKENRSPFSSEFDRSHCDGREHCLNTARISSLHSGQLHSLETPIYMEDVQRTF